MDRSPWKRFILEGDTPIRRCVCLRRRMKLTPGKRVARQPAAAVNRGSRIARVPGPAGRLGQDGRIVSRRSHAPPSSRASGPP